MMDDGSLKGANDNSASRPIDRRRLLQMRSNALSALPRHPDMPQRPKELYKHAADQIQVVLRLGRGDETDAGSAKPAEERRNPLAVSTVHYPRRSLRKPRSEPWSDVPFCAACWYWLLPLSSVRPGC